MKRFCISMILLAGFYSASPQAWVPVPIPAPSGVEQMLIANNTFYIATWDGVYKSVDGTYWDSCSNGITATMGITYNTCIYNFNNVLYTGARAKVYRSSDWGSTWALFPGAEASLASVNTTLLVSGDTILVGWDGSNGGIKRSFDNGQTWTFTTLPYVNKHILRYNGKLYVKTHGGVFTSTNNAITFSQLAGGLPTFTGSGGGLIESNGVLVCAIFLHGVYTSQDEGATWSKRTTVNGFTSNLPSSLTLINGVIYCGSSDGKVFRSADNGLNWTDITATGIPGSQSVKCFAVFNNELYAGSSAALYKTNLPGNTNLLNEALDIRLFPIPANDYLHVSISGIEDTKYLYITDARGRLIIKSTVNTNEVDIHTAELAAGVYFLELRSASLSIRRKVIIDR